MDKSSQSSMMESEKFKQVNLSKKKVNCICGQPVEAEEEEEEIPSQAQVKVKIGQSPKSSWKNYWSQSLDKIQNGPLEKLSRIFTRKYGIFSGSYTTELWDRNWEILDSTD